MEVERAFARTMADRDHEAFAAFLSEEAVFFSGTTAQRGKASVAAHWKRYFEMPEAPFSWAPETVAVLDSGTLALSTGPVWNPAGVRISTFTSIWRQEQPGVWRIVFDKGNQYCEGGQRQHAVHRSGRLPGQVVTLDEELDREAAEGKDRGVEGGPQSHHWTKYFRESDRVKNTFA